MLPPKKKPAASQNGENCDPQHSKQRNTSMAMDYTPPQRDGKWAGPTRLVSSRKIRIIIKTPFLRLAFIKRREQR